jgi:hypothetical protein
MTSAIPASQIVNSIPGVLGTGGTGVTANGVLIDNSGDTSIPIGTVQPFSSLTAVQNWYGAASNQAAWAAVYFGGFIGCTQLPSVLYVAQYNTAAVAAYVRSGSLSGLTLTQLQALSGTINTVVNGTSYTSSTINLSSASSFTNAAALIQTGIQTGGNTATCTYDSLRGAFVITSSTTGPTSTMGAVTGTLAAGVYLTAATGAVTSQGAAITTPAATMALITAAQLNWITFSTLTEPTLAIKEGFANWVTATSTFIYVCADSDATPTTGGVDAACFAQVTAAYNGVVPVWYNTAVNPLPLINAFIMGTTASINFSATNGRISYDAKGQAGLLPDVTSLAIATNLSLNGYNYYGNYANSSQQWQFLEPGAISGTWDWIDDYVNQIYWNAQFQVALLTLKTNTNSIPYANLGYAQIVETLKTPITSMGTFGGWQAGVSLSGAQASAINAAAGIAIAPTLQSPGWYLLVADPGPTVRNARGTPIIRFFYTDGGSVRTMSIASTDVQ